MSIKVLQNFYKTTLLQSAGSGTGVIYVAAKPTPSSGWLVISPANSTLREIIEYSSTGTDGTGDYVVASARGVGGTTAQTHSVNEPVRMNFTAQHQQEISDLIDTKAPTADPTFTGTVTVPSPSNGTDAANKQYVDDKTGSALAVEVAQVSHGFVVGDIIRLNGINSYAKAQANSAANAEVVGIVTIVTDADNFAYTTEGAVTAGVPAVAAETVLFLSADTAGALTATAPTTAGYINLPLAVVTQNATKMVFHKYRGFEIGSTTAQASSIATYTVTDTTLSLTTGANDKVIVQASGIVDNDSTAGQWVRLNYDGNVKHEITVDYCTNSGLTPFALHYSETPGAGTKNITVTAQKTIVSGQCIIIAQVITPVSVSVGRTPNVQTVIDAATITPVATTDDVVDVTAIAQAFTIAAPTGTVANGQKLLIRIKDNGTARAITWNAIYRAIGVTLPATTVLSKTHYIGAVYNSNATKWDVVAVGVEA